MDLMYWLDGANLVSVTRVRLLLFVLFWILEAMVVAIAMGLGQRFNNFHSPYAPQFLLVSGIALLSLLILSLCFIRIDKRLAGVGIVTLAVIIIGRTPGW